MNEFSIVYTTFNNPKMLTRQMQEWENFPREVEVILIDDHSDIPAADLLRPLPNLRVFRTTTKIPWNQHGCRNIGASQAEKPWLVMLDIDHLLTSVNVSRLQMLALDKANYYIFRRHATGGRAVRVGINQFCVDRKAYWAAGGYDEDLCGYYGGDHEWYRRAKKILQPMELPLSISMFLTTDVDDCTTKGYTRKSPENSAALEAIKQLKARYRLGPLHMRTPYEIVKL